MKKKNTLRSSLARKLALSTFSCMIALVATVTSTYAWFSMNRTVTVTGMSMQAVTPDSLEIILDYDREAVETGTDKDVIQTAQDALDWKFSVELSGMTGTTSLTPCHYNNVVNSSAMFYINTPENPITEEGKATVAFDATDEENWHLVSSSGVEAPSTYYTSDDVFLRVNGNSGKTYTVGIETLKFSIDTVSASKQIYKAARIGFLYNNTLYTYAIDEEFVLDTNDNTYKASLAALSDELEFELTGATFDDAAKVATIADVAQVSIYLWFDGEDEYCVNAHAIDSIFDIELMFSCEEKAN